MIMVCLVLLRSQLYIVLLFRKENVSPVKITVEWSLKKTAVLKSYLLISLRQNVIVCRFVLKTAKENVNLR